MRAEKKSFMRPNRSRIVRPFDERGEFTAGCWVWLVLMAFGAYAAYLFIIPLYEYSNFESHLSDMMPYYRGLDANTIQRNVIEAGKEYDINLKPKQVKVQVLRGDNRIIIDVEYSRNVELPFYTHTLTFRPHLTGSVF